MLILNYFGKINKTIMREYFLHNDLSNEQFFPYSGVLCISYTPQLRHFAIKEMDQFSLLLYLPHLWNIWSDIN